MTPLILSSMSLLLLSSMTMNKMNWPILSSSLMIMTFTTVIHLSTPFNLTHYMNFSFILDNLSLPLILLTMWISALMLMSSTKVTKLKTNPNFFSLNLLLLNFILIMCFSSSNMLSFYIFFESSLIPTLIIIVSWGYQPERLQATLYLMLYTLTASLPLLIAILFIFYSSNSISLFLLYSTFPTINTPFLLSLWWMALIMAFLAKLPMFTLHLWLPKAHVEAPVAGSMILAAILLKLGGYGLIRMMSLFHSLAASTNYWFSSMAIWGATMTTFICIRQTDMKSLIAYSSVSHMGLLIASLMSVTLWGIQGAMMLMVAHGLCSSAMFSTANMFFESTSTRSLYMMKGLMSLFPTMTMWWFLLNAMNMAAPPSINLMSELALFMGATSMSLIFMIPISITSFMTGAYSLYLFTSPTHGTLTSYTSPIHMFSPMNNTIMTLHLMPILMLTTDPNLIMI